MGSYRTVLVGTDGSDSSMKAVEHAAAFAAQQGAKLVIATAHFHEVEKGSWSRAAAPEKSSDRRAEDALGRESGYKRARAAGAQDILERSVIGAPVEALVKLAEDVEAELLVVGDVGLDTTAGRLLGSVPADVARKAKIDILIVHTVD
ncbi:universal stress protein [Mycolicibacterium sp. CBMA 361]|uniref:universal stress protein n=1 Tax=Mycolicibacterium sp. CBMA 361 TaxID=2606610 RepID=UPI0012DEAB2E|nr:universal stress protein [Mycolicibacterium sp. CBMA 361]MUM32549.1 universal stress protein [Mycolicibacterium sp. CBMA 361]